MDETELGAAVWPCLNCGADQAPLFKFRDSDFKVFECTNCELPKQDKHLDSDLCWCKPSLMHICKDGHEHWVHNRLQ